MTQAQPIIWDGEHAGHCVIDPETSLALFDWMSYSVNPAASTPLTYPLTTSLPGSLTPRVMETTSEYSPAEVSHTFKDYGSSGWQRSVYPSDAQATSFPHDGKMPYRVAQPRRIRHLTTKEEAKFQCEVHGCGKLFGRRCHFKEHLKTHDKERDHPFSCPTNDCNWKFMRKADLKRHHQTVHKKERNYKCNYCSRLLKRKDSLIR
ncbi:hypothetical protein QBC46DRAFT_409026 [Diplogelasinospora grovesii]|uniref:C2H2-type domain-containing protein n=1 Tax=Diplogelasinospora grovesii TaxID=303347 RepID=A0AAN6N6A2_9PEZI|nr:hypothetical protein QBC46DRAFT_409026 [Diplogelasinospora grovesii]